MRKAVFLIVFASIIGACNADAQTPSVVTTGATNTTATSTQLNGTIIMPNDTGITVWFRYGTTISLDSQTTPTVYGNSQQVAVNTIINNLLCDTTYYFCFASQNSNGIAMGSIYSFNTLTCVMTNISEIQISDVYIAPNPIITSASITLTRSEDGVFLLYDMCGKKVDTHPIKSGYGQIEKGNLSPGWYFYHIDTGSDLYVGKILIE